MFEKKAYGYLSVLFLAAWDTYICMWSALGLEVKPCLVDTPKGTTQYIAMDLFSFETNRFHVFFVIIVQGADHTNLFSQFFGLGFFQLEI